MNDFEFRKVTAIFRIERLEAAEKALQDLRVPGVSVTRVKGYGEYVDLYARDWMTEHARMEIFVHASEADRIVDALSTAASTGTRGDGIVCVLPVERLVRIRTRDSPERPG